MDKLHRKTILALDLGTKTGWAISNQEGKITSGTEKFQPSRFEGGGMPFLRFRRWLALVDHFRQIDDMRICIVVFPIEIIQVRQ